MSDLNERVAELRTDVRYIREAVERIEHGTRDLAVRQTEHERHDERRFEAVNLKLNRIIGGLILAGSILGALATVFAG